MARKGQAAMEFLMTYGWAILVGLTVIGTLSYFGVFNTQDILPEKCDLGPGLKCVDYHVSEGEAVLVVQSTLGREITIRKLNFAEGGMGDSFCSSSLSKLVQTGDTVTISCEGGPKEKTKQHFVPTINFEMGGQLFEVSGELFTSVDDEAADLPGEDLILPPEELIPPEAPGECTDDDSAQPFNGAMVPGSACTPEGCGDDYCEPDGTLDEWTCSEAGVPVPAKGIVCSNINPSYVCLTKNDKGYCGASVGVFVCTDSDAGNTDYKNPGKAGEDDGSGIIVAQDACTEVAELEEYGCLDGRIVSASVQCDVMYGDGWTCDADVTGGYCRGPPDALVEICDDNMDNDDDLVIDCADPDCAASLFCVPDFPESICDDKVDNDGDDLVDCADVDCKLDSACVLSESVCDDEIDNDNDKMIDCSDPDCLGGPSCPQCTDSDGGDEPKIGGKTVWNYGKNTISDECSTVFQNQLTEYVCNKLSFQEKLIHDCGKEFSLNCIDPDGPGPTPGYCG